MAVDTVRVLIGPISAPDGNMYYLEEKSRHGDVQYNVTLTVRRPGDADTSDVVSLDPRTGFDITAWPKTPDNQPHDRSEYVRTYNLEGDLEVQAWIDALKSILASVNMWLSENVWGGEEPEPFVDAGQKLVDALAVNGDIDSTGRYFIYED